MEWTKTEEGHSVLGLTRSEVNELCKEFLAVKKAIQKKYEYYLDLHEVGEATSLQQTLMLEYKERLWFINQLYDEATQR